jgi:hypothetical protein
MSNMKGIPTTISASDREAAKGHADHPLMLEYIKRLEAIANAAWELYQNSPTI